MERRGKDIVVSFLAGFHGPLPNLHRCETGASIDSQSAADREKGERAVVKGGGINRRRATAIRLIEIQVLPRTFDLAA